MIFIRFFTVILVFILNFNFCYAQEIQKDRLNKGLFDYIRYEELVELSKTESPKSNLKQKIDYILNTPIVDNSINQTSNLALQENPKIGKFMRIASWNINRGLNLDAIKLMFSNIDESIMTVKGKDREGLDEVINQAQILRNTDIFVLNEVDIGMPRTGYRNVVEEFADTLKMNYAYGIEFLEVDPAHLGLEEYKWSEERFLFPKDEHFIVDKDKYKGLHGTAILSRFPIKNCRIIRLPNSYDWFIGEVNRISQLETVKRHAAEKVFREELIREIRHGSRIALIADIKVPNLKTPITVVAAHFENRTTPKGREKQLEYLLKNLYGIKNPVIFAGDFNTMGSDGSPTGVKKEIIKRLKDPQFIAKSLIMYPMPYSLAINSVLTTTNFARRFADPTVGNIPVIAPNAERKFFDKIRKANFADNHRFDFRGRRDKSSNGKSGTLANSNERSLKGFTPTFIFNRPLYVGKYKLDWIFVKSYLDKPDDKSGPYKLAPHYGRTLYELNYAYNDPLSDHVPVTVDIPIYEQARRKNCSNKD